MNNCFECGNELININDLGKSSYIVKAAKCCDFCKILIVKKTDESDFELIACSFEEKLTIFININSSVSFYKNNVPIIKSYSDLGIENFNSLNNKDRLDVIRKLKDNIAFM